MNAEETKYLFFYVKNHTNTYTTTGYTLSCTPFTFIPVLDTGAGDIVSTTRLMWDFGDGTTSRDITATHYYNIPGTYNVTCYLYTTGGQGYESSFVQNIFVHDYISDTIAISADRASVIEAGHYQSPFLISRFNSWQTYPTLSATGATILLFATDTGAPLLDQDAYELDKYAHLKPYSRFLAYEYNAVLGQEELVPVNSVQTVNNTEIYVRVDDNYNIVQCAPGDLGSTLAGTSGSRVLFFVDDLVSVPSGGGMPKPVTTLAYFDTTQMLDNDSFAKGVPTSKYPVLHQVVDSSYAPVFVYQNDIDRMTITSNGIDTQGVSAMSGNFDITPDKFVGQKIPFVVKVKDSSNFSVKSVSLLSAVPDTAPLSAGNIKLYMHDMSNAPIVDGMTFHADFKELSSMTTGGFFKGYLSSVSPHENVHIHAVARIVGEEYFKIPTAYACVAHPQSKTIHVIDIQENLAAGNLGLTDNITDVEVLTGIYSTGVVPSRSSTGEITYTIWAVDSDSDRVVQYDTYGNVLLEGHILSGSSPSNIVADGNKDVWVSLYDAVSTVKLDHTTGNIIACVVPPFENLDLSSPELYYTLSGYAGSNSILPASVDVDKNNNLWVAYNYPLSGLVCKFDTHGNLLSTIHTGTAYVPGEILTTLDNKAWLIYKDTSASSPLDGRDAIVMIDDSAVPHVYPANTSLWNLTFDIGGDIWATGDKNTVLHLNTTTHQFTTYTLPSADNVSDISDLAGIACTTSNTILVVNEAQQRLFFFNVSDAVSGNISALSSVGLLTPSDLNNDPEQNMLNAYGDWTGFRHISRFYKTHVDVTLSADSASFNIYPADGKYSIAKVNENFNPVAQYNAYVFQESLQDYTKLFTDFFGAAVGSAEDGPNVLGKKTYEKISNFCNNISYIDTCNIGALKELYQEMNSSFVTLQENSFNYPANVSRLMDLFSIKLSKLRGSRNKFAENFNNRGFNNNAYQTPGMIATVKYGANKGEEINILTATLTGGIDGNIIAYEKFADQYHLINTNLASATYVPYIDPARQIYALSSYDARWGWGLVLPEIYAATDLSKYYTFYRYSPSVDNSQVEGVVNWSDPNTTIPETIENINQWNAIMENMLTYTLATGLEILSA